VSTANVLVVGGGGGGGGRSQAGGNGGGGNANGVVGTGARSGQGGLNNGTGGGGAACCCMGGASPHASAGTGGNQGVAGLPSRLNCHGGGGGGGVGAGGAGGTGGCCEGIRGLFGVAGSGVNGGSSPRRGGGGASWNGARGTVGSVGTGHGGGQGVAAGNCSQASNRGGGGGGYGGGGGGGGIGAGGGGGFAGGGGGGNGEGGGGSGFVRTNNIANVANFIGNAGGTTGATDSPGGRNGHVRITLLVVPPDQNTFPAAWTVARGGVGTHQIPSFDVGGTGNSQFINALHVTTNPAMTEAINAGGLSFVGLNPAPGGGGGGITQHSGVVFGGTAAPTTVGMTEANCAVRQGFIYFEGTGYAISLRITHVNRHMENQIFWVRVRHIVQQVYRWVRFTINTSVGDWRNTNNWTDFGPVQGIGADERRVGTAVTTGGNGPSLASDWNTWRWNPTSVTNPTLWFRHAILPGTHRYVNANWFRELAAGNGLHGQPMDSIRPSDERDRIAFRGAGTFVVGHGNEPANEPNVGHTRADNLTAHSTTGPTIGNLAASHNERIRIDAPAGTYSARFFVLRVTIDLVEHRNTARMQSSTWAVTTLRTQVVDIIFFVAPPPVQTAVPTFTVTRGTAFTIGRDGPDYPDNQGITSLNVTSQATEISFVGMGTNMGIFNSRDASTANLATTHLDWTWDSANQSIRIYVQHWCNNRLFSVRVQNAMAQIIWVDFRINTPDGLWTGFYMGGYGEDAIRTNITLEGGGNAIAGRAATATLPDVSGNNHFPAGNAAGLNFNNLGTGASHRTIWLTRSVSPGEYFTINAIDNITPVHGGDVVTFDGSISFNNTQGGRITHTWAAAHNTSPLMIPSVRITVGTGVFDSMIYHIRLTTVLRENHSINNFVPFATETLDVFFFITQPPRQTAVPVALTGGRGAGGGGGSITQTNNRLFAGLHVIERNNTQSTDSMSFGNGVSGVIGTTATLNNQGVFRDRAMQNPATDFLEWTLSHNHLNIISFRVWMVNEPFFVAIRNDRGEVLAAEFRVTTTRPSWDTSAGWQEDGLQVRLTDLHHEGVEQGRYKLGMSNTHNLPSGTDAPFMDGNNPLTGWRFNPHHTTPALTMWVERPLTPSVTSPASFTFPASAFRDLHPQNREWDAILFAPGVATFWENNQSNRLSAFGTLPQGAFVGHGYTHMTIHVAAGSPASFDDLFFTLRLRLQEVQGAGAGVGYVFNHQYVYVVFRLRSQPPAQSPVPNFVARRGQTLTEFGGIFRVVGNTIPALNVVDPDETATALHFLNFSVGADRYYANRTGIFLESNTNYSARYHLAWSINSTRTEVQIHTVLAFAQNTSFWMQVENSVGITSWVRFTLTTLVDSYQRTGGWLDDAGNAAEGIYYNNATQTRVGRVPSTVVPQDTSIDGHLWNFNGLTDSTYPVLWAMRSVNPGDNLTIRADQFFMPSEADRLRDTAVFSDIISLSDSQGGRIVPSLNSAGGALSAFGESVTIHVGAGAFAAQFYLLRLAVQLREISPANDGHLHTHFANAADSQTGIGGTRIVHIIFTVTQPPAQPTTVPVFSVNRGVEDFEGVGVRTIGDYVPLNFYRSLPTEMSRLNIIDGNSGTVDRPNGHNNIQSSNLIEFYGVSQNVGIFLTASLAQPATDFLQWDGGVNGLRITEVRAVATRYFYVRVRNRLFFGTDDARNRDGVVGWVRIRIEAETQGWVPSGYPSAWSDEPAGHLFTNVDRGFRVGRATTHVEVDVDNPNFGAWTTPSEAATPMRFNPLNPNGITMWIDRPIVPGSSFSVYASDFFSAVDAVYDRVVFSTVSERPIYLPNTQGGLISIGSTSSLAPLGVHARSLSINIANGNFPQSFFYFRAYVELRENSTVNSLMRHTGPIPVYVAFRVDNVRTRLSNFIVATIDVGEVREISLSDFAVDPNGNAISIVDIVVPAREWMPVDPMGVQLNTTLLPTGARDTFSYATMNNQLTRNGPREGLWQNDGIAPHHPFSLSQDAFNYRSGIGTIGHAQGTIPTGFNPYLVTRLPTDNAPSLFDTAHAGASGAMVRANIIGAGQSIALTGLRPSRSQYLEGRRTVGMGHFYILVRIQDEGNPSDLGIWLPIAISVRAAAVGGLETRPGNISMEAGVSTEAALNPITNIWGGGGYQYFTPFGAGTHIPSMNAVLNSAGFTGAGLGRGPFAPLAAIPGAAGTHWTAIPGSTTQLATRALEEGIFIDWRMLGATNLRATQLDGTTPALLNTNLEIGNQTQRRFLNGTGYNFGGGETNFNRFFEIELVPMFLPRVVISHFTAAEIAFARSRGLFRDMASSTEVLTLGHIFPNLLNNTTPQYDPFSGAFEVIAFYGLRVSALHSTMGYNLEIPVRIQSIREGFRADPAQASLLPSEEFLRTDSRLLIGILNSGPTAISSSSFDSLDGDISIGEKAWHANGGVINVYLYRNAAVTFSVYDFAYDNDVYATASMDRSLVNPRSAAGIARQEAVASLMNSPSLIRYAGGFGFFNTVDTTNVFSDRLAFNHPNNMEVTPSTGAGYVTMLMQSGSFGASTQVTITAVARNREVSTVFELEIEDSMGSSLTVAVMVTVINTAPEFTICPITGSIRSMAVTSSTLDSVVEFRADQLATDADDDILSFVGGMQVITVRNPVSNIDQLMDQSNWIHLGADFVRAELAPGTGVNAGHMVMRLTAVSSTQGITNGVWVAFNITDGEIDGGLLSLIRVRVYNSPVEFNLSAFDYRAAVGTDEGGNALPIALPAGHYVSIVESDGGVAEAFFVSSPGIVGILPGSNAANTRVLGLDPDGMQHMIPIALNPALRTQRPTLPEFFYTSEANFTETPGLGNWAVPGTGASPISTPDFMRVFLPAGHPLMGQGGWTDGRIPADVFEFTYIARTSYGYAPFANRPSGTTPLSYHWALRVRFGDNFPRSAVRVEFMMADSNQELRIGADDVIGTVGGFGAPGVPNTAVRSQTVHFVQTTRTIINNFSEMPNRQHELRGYHIDDVIAGTPTLSNHVSVRSSAAPNPGPIRFDGITVPGRLSVGGSATPIHVPFAYFATAWRSSIDGSFAQFGVGLASNPSSTIPTIAGDGSPQAHAAFVDLSLRSGTRVWTGATFHQNPYITVQFSQGAAFHDINNPFNMGDRLVRHSAGSGNCNLNPAEGYVIAPTLSAATHIDVTSGLEIRKNHIRGNNLTLSVRVASWTLSGGNRVSAHDPIVVDVPLTVENDLMDVTGGGPTASTYNSAPSIDVVTDMRLGARVVDLRPETDAGVVDWASTHQHFFSFDNETIHANNTRSPYNHALHYTHRERALFSAASLRFEFTHSTPLLNRFNNLAVNSSTTGANSIRDGYFGGISNMNQVLQNQGSINDFNPNAGFENFFRVTNLLTPEGNLGGDAASFSIVPIRQMQFNIDNVAGTQDAAYWRARYNLGVCTRPGAATNGLNYFPLTLIMYDDFMSSGFFNSSMHAVVIRVFIRNSPLQVNTAFTSDGESGNVAGNPVRNLTVHASSQRTLSLAELFVNPDARMSGLGASDFMTRQEILDWVSDCIGPCDHDYDLLRLTTDVIYMVSMVVTHRHADLTSAEQNLVTPTLNDTQNPTAVVLNVGNRPSRVPAGQIAFTIELTFRDSGNNQATVTINIRFGNAVPSLHDNVVMGTQTITMRSGDSFTLVTADYDAFMAGRDNVLSGGATVYNRFATRTYADPDMRSWWSTAANNCLRTSAGSHTPGSGSIGNFIAAEDDVPWSLRFDTAALRFMTPQGGAVQMGLVGNSPLQVEARNRMLTDIPTGAGSGNQALTLTFTAVAFVRGLTVTIPIFDEQHGSRVTLTLRIDIESTPPIARSTPIARWNDTERQLSIDSDADFANNINIYTTTMRVGQTRVFQLLDFVDDPDRGDNLLLNLRNKGIGFFYVGGENRNSDDYVTLAFNASSTIRYFSLTARNFHAPTTQNPLDYSMVIFDVLDPHGAGATQIKLRVRIERNELLWRGAANEVMEATVDAVDVPRDPLVNPAFEIQLVSRYAQAAGVGVPVIVDGDFGALNARYNVTVYSLITLGTGGSHGVLPIGDVGAEHRVARLQQNAINTAPTLTIFHDPNVVAAGVTEFWRFVDRHSFGFTPSGCTIRLLPLMRTNIFGGTLAALPILIRISKCDAVVDNSQERSFRLNMRIQNSLPVAIGNTINNTGAFTDSFVEDSFLYFHGERGMSRTYAVYERRQAHRYNDRALFRDPDVNDSVWISSVQLVDMFTATLFHNNTVSGGFGREATLSYMGCGAVRFNFDNEFDAHGNRAISFTINHRPNFGAVTASHLPVVMVYRIFARDALSNHVDNTQDGTNRTVYTDVWVIIHASTPTFTDQNELPSNMRFTRNTTTLDLELTIVLEYGRPFILDIPSILDHNDLILDNYARSDRLRFAPCPQGTWRYFLSSICYFTDNRADMITVGSVRDRENNEHRLFTVSSVPVAPGQIPNMSLALNALTTRRGTSEDIFLYLVSVTGRATNRPLRITLVTGNSAPALKDQFNPNNSNICPQTGIATLDVFARGGLTSIGGALQPTRVNILDFITDRDYGDAVLSGTSSTWLRVANPAPVVQNDLAIVTLLPDGQTLNVAPRPAQFGTFEFHLMIADGPSPLIPEFFPGGFSVTDFDEMTIEQIERIRAHNRDISDSDKFLIVRFSVTVTPNPIDIQPSEVGIPQFTTRSITAQRVLNSFDDTVWRTDAFRNHTGDNYAAGLYIYGLDLVDRNTTAVAIYVNGRRIENSALPVTLDSIRRHYDDDNLDVSSINWAIRGNSLGDLTYVDAQLGLRTDAAAARVWRTFPVRIVPNLPPRLMQQFEGYHVFGGDGTNVFRLRAQDFITDPEGDELTLVSVRSVRTVIVAASLSGGEMVLNFAGSGFSEIIVEVRDGSAIHTLSFTARNNDLRRPNIFIRIWGSVQAHPIIYGVLLGLIILLLITLIIILAVLRRKKRIRSEIEALLLAELEMEEEQLRLAASANASYMPNYGMLNSAANQPMYSQHMQLGQGGSHAAPTPPAMMLGAGQGGQATPPQYPHNPNPHLTQQANPFAQNNHNSTPTPQFNDDDL